MSIEKHRIRLAIAESLDILVREHPTCFAMFSEVPLSSKVAAIDHLTNIVTSMIKDELSKGKDV